MFSLVNKHVFIHERDTHMNKGLVTVSLCSIETDLLVLSNSVVEQNMTSVSILFTVHFFPNSNVSILFLAVTSRHTQLSKLLSYAFPQVYPLTLACDPADRRPDMFTHQLLVRASAPFLLLPFHGEPWRDKSLVR